MENILCERLNIREAAVLLRLHREMDRLLDEGMVKKEVFIHTLKRALSHTMKIIREFEEEGGKICSQRLFVAFLDHFNQTHVICNENYPNAFSDMHKMLREKGVMEKNIHEVAIQKCVFTKDLIIKNLEVSGEFLGFTVLSGEDMGPFQQEFVTILSEKIDTDIYQNNQHAKDLIKINGIEKIHSILSSDRSISKKYYLITRFAAELIGASSGYLVVPTGGKPTIVARYIHTGSHPTPPPLKKEKVLDLAFKAMEKAKTEGIQAQNGAFRPNEPLTVVLHPAKYLEGVLILCREELQPAQAEIIGSLAHFVDSTLHINHLYARAFESFLHALGVIIDTFEIYTYGHSHRVMTYSQAIGASMGLSNLEMTKLRIAAMLHDIGKISLETGPAGRGGPPIPLHESTIVQSHAARSQNIIKGLFPEELQDIYSLVGTYHNKDSRGLSPLEYRSGEIPTLSRIISLADYFDSLTSDRPYRQGYSWDQSMEILRKEVAEGSLSGDLVALLQEPKVWEMIRFDFQDMKIDSLLGWYEREMVPDLEPIRAEIKSARESLDDVCRLRKKFEMGEEIDLVSLEDSVLMPSDKDLLIQREAQKNRDEYFKTLDEIEKYHRERLNKLNARRDMEVRFRDKFWEQETAEQIYQDLIELNHSGVDLYEKRSDLRAIAGEMEEDSGSENIMGFLKSLMEKSVAAKGFNKNYLSPLGSAKKILDWLKK